MRSNSFYEIWFVVCEGDCISLSTSQAVLARQSVDLIRLSNRPVLR